MSDIVEVWFDSGSTHSFVLEKREGFKVASFNVSGRLRSTQRLVSLFTVRILRNKRKSAI
jgi:hypothetical protein